MAAMVLHHRVEHFLPLLLEVLSLLVALLHALLLVHGGQEHPPLLILFDLGHPGVGVFVCPLDSQHLVSVQSLVCHSLLRELSHASVNVFDEAVPLVR